MPRQSISITLFNRVTLGSVPSARWDEAFRAWGDSKAPNHVRLAALGTNESYPVRVWLLSQWAYGLAGRLWVKQMTVVAWI